MIRFFKLYTVILCRKEYGIKTIKTLFICVNTTFFGVLIFCINSWWNIIVKFSEYSLHKYLIHTNAKNWQNDNNFTVYLDHTVVDKIATHAYNSIE